MTKIVINTCHGGFSLSDEGILWYAALKGIEPSKDFYSREIPRDDPELVQTVHELGRKADGAYAELKIVEIPDDVEWQIEEYDGREWVAEKHRTWH